MKEEYEKIYKLSKSREEFVGTLLLADWDMPRATALKLWNEFDNKPKTTRGRPKLTESKDRVPFHEYEPDKIYELGDYFPEDEKSQPRAMKWMEFKDMCRMVKDRDRLDRKELSRYGFSQQEINWLIDNGYVKYGGYWG